MCQENGGTMHMDRKYATIPLFAVEIRRIYKEAIYSYVLSEGSIPINYPIYTIEEDMGCCMLVWGHSYDKEHLTLMVVKST